MFKKFGGVLVFAHVRKYIKRMIKHKMITTLFITILLLFVTATLAGAKVNEKLGLITVNENSYLNVREKANTTSKVIGTLVTDDVIEIVDVKNGWCEFEFKSKTAFVSSDYVKLVSQTDADELESSTKGKQLVATARKYLGTPYARAGSSPSTGFDCSGFTSYVFKEEKISLPRTADAQLKTGEGVKKSDLEYGDLVFFSTNGKTATHVGIYAGNNQIIHSPGTGKTVSYASLSTSYYSKNYFGAKRIVK